MFSSRGARKTLCSKEKALKTFTSGGISPSSIRSLMMCIGFLTVKTCGRKPNLGRYLVNFKVLKTPPSPSGG